MINALTWILTITYISTVPPFKNKEVTLIVKGYKLEAECKADEKQFLNNIAPAPIIKVIGTGCQKDEK